MRNNVIEPAKQFIVRYGDQAHAKALEAQLAARKERRGQLAAFYARVADKIEEVSTPSASANFSRSLLSH